jgi:hypothetical protein
MQRLGEEAVGMSRRNSGDAKGVLRVKLCLQLGSRGVHSRAPHKSYPASPCPTHGVTWAHLGSFRSPWNIK